MKFQYLTLFSVLLLVNCSSHVKKKSEAEKSTPGNEIIIDSANVEVKPKPTGIDLFIDSMKTANYLLDTNRVKQTIWSFMVKYPKTMDNGHQIIHLPFPVDSFSNHFTNPKTYFFAQWNQKEHTFKHGDDFLLMTWSIDSLGIKIEKEIYASLHEFMGNFPCYIFRSEKTVYAMCHRMSDAAARTRQLTEQLRNYIDASSMIYRPFERKI